jgi:hypothetical protein
MIYRTFTYLKWIVLILLLGFIYYKAKNFGDFRNRLLQIIDFLPLPSGVRTLIQMSRSVISYNEFNSESDDVSPDKPSKKPNRTTKRRVSSNHKKYVASNQKWKCRACGKLLDHSYEVDHIIPLYKGGTNDLHNLQALCRNCHGKKTIEDSLD